MVQQSDFYVDDNETIYASIHLPNASINDTTGHNVTFDMDDLDSLTGQSTVYVNSVKFRADLYNSDRTEVSDTVVFCLAGIVPSGTVSSYSNGLPRLADYQAIKGWPLKGCYGYAYGRGAFTPADYTNTGNYQKVSWQKTWKPRKALLLSRLQTVLFNVSLVTYFPLG